MTRPDVDGVDDNVLCLSGTPTYHFIVDKIRWGRPKLAIACGNVNNVRNADSSDIISLELAVDRNNRPCKDCIRDLSRVHGIEISICTICDRTDVIDDVECEDSHIPHGTTGEKEVSLCADCRDII